ncbi:fumarylacetoacetate hydrolase family protein [Subtercola sp. YIM 133946]|uniref:fumarylacetoacetate hydrolase family protein n=1 Tax=Subtercola sp. YIM 133946 TaxID=3118909 RepID=UPI002F933C37
MSFGPRHGEQPGVIVGDDIVAVRPILTAAALPCATIIDVLAVWPLAEPVLRAALDGADRIPLAGVRLGSPVPRPGTIVAIGFNYPSHTAEALASAPPAGPPIVFLKPPGSVSGPNDAIIRPPETLALDYEVELAVVIGMPGRRIPRASAARHIAGYMLANDVTARDVAFGLGLDYPLHLQVARGKGFQTFCPLGPWLVTSDELPADPVFDLRLAVNGETRQNGSTAEMAVDLAGLIESVSATMELRPGDVILTGTPAGCGFQMSPPRFLTPGDRVTAGGTSLGEMSMLIEDEHV